jgi:hypothetical protein
VTELDVLRERLEKIAALAGRPVRVDAVEARLEEALAENRLLRGQIDDLTRRLDEAQGRGRAVVPASSSPTPEGGWLWVVLGDGEGK